MSDIYDLGLHEHMHTDSQAPRNPDEPSIFPLTIMRVAGGWIYFAKSYAVFVPYNNDMVNHYKGVL